MKNLIIIVLLFCTIKSSSQLLTRILHGEPLFSPKINENSQGILLNLNTGTQSIGGDYLFTTKSKNPSDYLIYRLGVATKATDGVGPLFANGQFSPGVKLSAARTNIRVFASNIVKNDGTKSKFDDWLTFTATYSFEKNKLFSKENSFAKQITDTIFSGYSLGLDYTMALGSNEQDYFNFNVAYNRRNNYNDLSSIDVFDNRLIYDSLTSTQRSIEKKVTAKEGIYKEMDAAIIQISYTRLPKYEFKNRKNANGSDMTFAKEETTTEYLTNNNGKIDTVTRKSIKTEPVPNPNFKLLKFGYSVFYNLTAQNGEKPQTRVGGSIFLISPNKEGNLVPRISINVQIKDLYNVMNTNDNIPKRIQAGITATFSI